MKNSRHQSIETLAKPKLDIKEKLSNALKDFHSQYRNGDIQAFSMGLTACEEIMKPEIEVQREYVVKFMGYLIKCLDKDGELIKSTSSTFLGIDFMNEIMDSVSDYYNLTKEKQA